MFVLWFLLTFGVEQNGRKRKYNKKKFWCSNLKKKNTIYKLLYWVKKSIATN